MTGNVNGRAAAELGSRDLSAGAFTRQRPEPSLEEPDPLDRAAQR
jgi:hypothetical protein